MQKILWHRRKSRNIYDFTKTEHTTLPTLWLANFIRFPY